jgi:hypothetical protein
MPLTFKYESGQPPGMPVYRQYRHSNNSALLIRGMALAGTIALPAGRVYAFRESGTGIALFIRN